MWQGPVQALVVGAVGGGLAGGAVGGSVGGGLGKAIDDLFWPDPAKPDIGIPTQPGGAQPTQNPEGYPNQFPSGAAGPGEVIQEGFDPSDSLAWIIHEG